jgi:biotin-dependent carboxylase-like uncharacterized protein
MADLTGSRTGSTRPLGSSAAGAIEVLNAPPMLTVQDDGRRTGRSMGIPRSGAMDPVALHATNALVGNPPDAAALEWAGGGGRLRVRRPLLIAMGGAHADLRLGGQAVPWGVMLRARPGDVLEISAPTWGRWLYVAVSGGIAVPEALGSRSTYMPAAIGGYHGRKLATGDMLPVGLVPTAPPDPRQAFDLREAMMDVLARQHVNVVAAPSPSELPERFWSHLVSRPLTVLAESSRMGTRLALSGSVTEPPQMEQESATRPSEPACIGLVQATPSGQSLVIMPDGPTLCGYPPVACVRSQDIAVLAQRAPGERVRFIAR